MPTPVQVSKALAKKYSKDELKQAIAGIDMILLACDAVAATHATNPALTENGEKKL